MESVESGKIKKMGLQIRVADISGSLTISARQSQPSTDYKAKPEALMPICEKNLRWMLAGTALSCFRSRYPGIRWTIPLLSNLCIAGSCFVIVWYPSYYINQAIVWTVDTVLIWIVHSYILFLQSRWDVSSCFDILEIPRWVNRITLIFYWAFIVYWAYFAGIMFSIHSSVDGSKEGTWYILQQLGNVYMSTAWWFFFSTAGALYYFICAKLFQRSMEIQSWLLQLKQSHPPLEEFYRMYNYHCKKIRRFGAHWNFIIFLGFILLTLHVPIDLLSIIVDKNYYDIPGAVIKGLALAWYLFCICHLNDLEGRVVSTLYKERVYSLEDIQMIEKYIEYRGIGLDFYGIRINTGFIMKVVLLVLNFIVPTAYAVLSKWAGISGGE